MNESELLKDKITHIFIGDKKYFLVDSLKLKYGYIKTQSVLSIDNKNVLAENVDKYTEFYKSIKKTLNFNVNKYMLKYC